MHTPRVCFVTVFVTFQPVTTPVFPVIPFFIFERTVFVDEIQYFRFSKIQEAPILSFSHLRIVFFAVPNQPKNTLTEFFPNMLVWWPMCPPFKRHPFSPPVLGLSPVDIIVPVLSLGGFFLPFFGSVGRLFFFSWVLFRTPPPPSPVSLRPPPLIYWAPFFHLKTFSHPLYGHFNGLWFPELGKRYPNI